MKMLRGQFFILLFVYIDYPSWAINATYDIGKELWNLISMLDGIELNADNLGDLNELISNGKNREIGNQMDEIHNQLGRMEESLDSKTISDFIKLPPSEIMLYKCMNTFTLFILSIDEYYEKFYHYMRNNSYNIDDRSRNLMHTIIADAEANLVVIRKIILEAQEFLPHSRNLAFAITGYANTIHTQICGGSRIISNSLVQLFTMVVIAEIKVNVMLAFRNIHQSAVNGAWKIVNSILREQFAKHFGKYVEIFESNIAFADPIYLRACDPDHGIWIRDKSFYELEGSFQTTIFRYHWLRCKHNPCNDIWSNRRGICDATLYDRRSGCSAAVAKCTYLSAVQACVLKSGPYKFQYVNSTKLGFLGRNSTCPENNGYVIEDGSGWNLTYAACACNCHGHHNKISLSIIESNTKFNRVIIGLRFLRQKDILYIQPRGGTLDVNGNIRRHSERWISIPSKTASSTINGENRFFFFDDLRLPSGYVLTGIKFNKVSRGNITGFAIEIFGVPFDYRSGKLHLEARLRISRQVSKNESGMRLSFNAVSSIYTKLRHTLSPPNMTYVSLTKSKLEDDFGQSTLPLFDAVPVSAHRPSALGGIGIFHKGVEGYAGFISLRGYGLAYTEYFTEFQSAYIADGRVHFNVSEHN